MASRVFVTSLLVLFVMLVAVCHGGPPSSPLDLLTSSKLTEALGAAEKLKELIHRTSSNHIGTHEKTSGFEFLHVMANAQSSEGLSKEFLQRVISRSLVPFAKGSKEIKEVVDVFKEYVKYDVEKHQEQFFAIVSNKGHGKTEAIFVYFKVRDDGKYNFKKLLFRGIFRLAADLVITRSTKKGFFKSSSKDVIRYLPRRGVTAKDINDLLNVIVPNIAKILNEFVPKPKDHDNSFFDEYMEIFA